MDGYLGIPIDPYQTENDTFIQAWENGLKTYESYEDSVRITSVRLRQMEYPAAFPNRTFSRRTVGGSATNDW